MSTIESTLTPLVPLMLNVDGKWFNLLQATCIDTAPLGGGVTIEFAIPLPAQCGRTTRTYRLTGAAAEALCDWLDAHSHAGLLYAPPTHPQRLAPYGVNGHVTE